MNSPDYMSRAEAALAAIERDCDRINDETDVDLDNQRSGGLISITFADKSQVIVNLQPPLEEIWMAAKSGGYHYRHDGQVWKDTKSGEELFDKLSREASAQSGHALRFTPR